MQDNYDQNLQPTCRVRPAYDPNQVGTYVVSCEVRDSSQNPAAAFERRIIISSIDKTPLEEAITAANKRLKDPKLVNDEKKTALEALIKEAEAAKNNPNLTTVDRDALIQRLQAAPLTLDTQKPVIS